jgi:hypothetical protein
MKKNDAAMTANSKRLRVKRMMGNHYLYPIKMGLGPEYQQKQAQYLDGFAM